nr:unnamed protein product [Digitaria exilis]
MVNPRISGTAAAWRLWSEHGKLHLHCSGADGGQYCLYGWLYGLLLQAAWLMTPQIAMRNSQGRPSSVNESTRKLNRLITSLLLHPCMAMAMGPSFSSRGGAWDPPSQSQGRTGRRLPRDKNFLQVWRVRDERTLAIISVQFRWRL